MSSYTAIGSGGTAWRVIGIADGTGQDAAGRYVMGKNVTFQLKSGPSGTVFVPGPHATAEAAAALIQVEADELEAMANLSHGM
jgi:hypothetical protein